MVARPMYYVGQVAYHEINLDYIIENFCINKEKPELKCNGKCHLAKQLQVVSKNDKNSDIVVNISASFYPIYFSEYQNVLFKTPFFINDVTPSSIYKDNYIFTFVSNHFKPPTV